MFQVKATVIGFLGDEKRYPCHFGHKIGDEFIYDGEKFIGRICSSMVPVLIPKMIAVHATGPRQIAPYHSYYPFWYAPASLRDPSQKKYDGLGFQNVLKDFVEPEYYLSGMTPQNAYKWPPHGVRDIAKDTSKVVCLDNKTFMTMQIEAFDISDKGFDVPFFRRQMAIITKVLPKPGIELDKILGEFSKEQIEGIYPALSQIMIQILAEELDLMGYLKIQDGKVSATKKGEAKLKDFQKKLTAEEREGFFCQGKSRVRGNPSVTG
ncbi:MAG: hypothetical protein ABSB22_18255 [Thermodesulfobacteriota bacterium]|jgi:uncharacterized repeat protein (TIGR04076 family)